MVVVRRFVCSRVLVREEALAHWGLSRQKQTNKQTKSLCKLHVERFGQSGCHNQMISRVWCGISEDLLSYGVDIDGAFSYNRTN